MGADRNFSYEGYPNRDSDIYGNYVAYCWDDGLEIEGANMNVRVWGNYITETYHPIATASVSLGPLYIFRNVAHISRTGPRHAYGQSLPAITSSRSRPRRAAGRRRICLSASPTHASPIPTASITTCTTGSSGLWPDRFSLAPSSPGHNAGAILPNFTDGYTGPAPDIGAHESGMPPMQFGIKAYLPAGAASQPAGWENWLGRKILPEKEAAGMIRGFLERQLQPRPRTSSRRAAFGFRWPASTSASVPAATMLWPTCPACWNGWTSRNSANSGPPAR